MPISAATNAPPTASEFTSLSALLRSAQRLARQDGAAAEAMIDAAIGRLSSLLAPQPAAAPTPATGGLAPWQQQLLTRHVAAHLSGPLPVEQLAALVRLGRSHFSRAFRKSFGQAPARYVRAARIAACQAAMLKGDTGLSQIALDAGFSDQAHFCRVFRAITGESPAAWRRRETKLAISA